MSDVAAVDPAAPAPIPAAAVDPAPAPAADPAPAPAPAAKVADPAPAPKVADPAADPAASFLKLRETVADKALRNVVDRFASLTDIAKAVVDLRTDNSQRVKVPAADASEEDRAKFRKALGVPDKADGYKIELPEGVEMTDADKVVLEAVLPIAHANGVPAAALNGFVSEFLGLQNEMQAAAVQQIEKFGKDAETALKREWGGDYETNMNLANRVGEALGGPQFKEFLNTTPLATGGMLGDHPVLARFLASLGRRADEGDLMLGATREEKSSIQTELDALNKAVPPGTAGYTEKSHQDRLAKLYGQLHGAGSIVGGGMRVA